MDETDLCVRVSVWLSSLVRLVLLKAQVSEKEQTKEKNLLIA